MIGLSPPWGRCRRSGRQRGLLHLPAFSTKPRPPHARTHRSKAGTQRPRRSAEERGEEVGHCTLMTPRARDRRRRWFTLAAIALAAGVLTNVLIACACAWWARPRGIPAWTTPQELSAARDPYARDGRIPEEWRRVFPGYFWSPAPDKYVSFGWTGALWRLEGVGEAHFAAVSPRHEVRVFTSGWPLPTAVGAIQTRDDALRDGYFRSWRAACMNRAVPAPMTLTFPPKWDRALPLNPLWTGLIVNTLVFGSAWLIVMLLLSGARRRRLAPGRCPACGYDRAGLAAGSVCPECGGNGGGEPTVPRGK